MAVVAERKRFCGEAAGDQAQMGGCARFGQNPQHSRQRDAQSCSINKKYRSTKTARESGVSDRLTSPAAVVVGGTPPIFGETRLMHYVDCTPSNPKVWGSATP